MNKTLSFFISQAVNGIKKFPKKTQLLFVIGTLFTASCSSELELTEEKMAIKTTPSIETVSPKDAIAYLNKKAYTTKSMFKSTESSSNLNFIYQEKITNSDQLLTIIPNNENRNSRYVFLNVDEKIEASIITTFPENTNTVSEFTGKIIIQNLDGSFINGFRLKNGFIISRLEKKPTSNLTIKNTDPDPIELLEVIIPPKEKEYFSIVFIYFPYGERANRGDLPESLMWDPTGGGYSGDEPATEESIAQAIEDQIDDSKLDPCLKAIMDQLKNTTNNDIALILKKLGANSIYEVNMVMKPAGTYGETQKMAKYNYEIRIDRERYTNSTTLFKATTLIHEMIHAYFLSIIDDYNYTPSTNVANFPELFEAYVLKTYPNSGDKQDAQHKEMAIRYVDAMASALQVYDANFTVPYEVYQDLAWGSLSAAPIFDKTYPPGTIENKRILNRYGAESSGHAIDQGTPNQQTPVGKPCK